LKEKYKKKKKKANLTLNLSKPNSRPPPGFDFLSSKPAAPLPFTDTNQPAAPPWIWCLLPSASAQTQPPLPPHRSHIFFFPFLGFDFVSSKPLLTASHHTKHSSGTHRHRPLPHPPALLCTDRPPALLPRPPPPDIPRGAKTINAWTTAATPPTPLPPETEKNEKAKEKNRSVERSRSETKKKRKRSRSVKERKIKTDCHLCVFLVVAGDGDPTAVVGRQRRRSRP